LEGNFSQLVTCQNSESKQIAYYGIPSAGILLLALLKQRKEPTSPRIPAAKVITDLTVLAAEIDRGTVVRPEDPNYALLSEAAQTIQRFLDGVLGEKAGLVVQEQMGFQFDDQWLAQWAQDPKDFDIDFWHGLGDHSSLFGVDVLPIT
jgi:hypothetical protein